jgi:hypothetical protein
MSEVQDERKVVVPETGEVLPVVTLEELAYSEYERLKARLAHELYQARETMAPQRREVHRLRSLANYFKRRLETEDTPELRQRATQAETLFLEASRALAFMADDYATEQKALRHDDRLAWRKLKTYGLIKPKAKVKAYPEG